MHSAAMKPEVEMAYVVETNEETQMSTESR
jgi:hypothetical protein